jgi:hypothetical protein
MQGRVFAFSTVMTYLRIFVFTIPQQILLAIFLLGVAKTNGGKQIPSETRESSRESPVKQYISAIKNGS